MPITYLYVKKRKDFGRPCLFSELPSTCIVDVEPVPTIKQHFVKMRYVDKEIQCSSHMSIHEVNTEHFTRDRRGISHIEGGWPKDIEAREEEQTLRFRKKIEKDEVYINSTLQLGLVMEHYVKQNNVVDIYEQYFPSEEIEEQEDKPTAKTINLFRDYSGSPLPVNNISWSTGEDSNKRLAAAYCSINFQGCPNDFTRDSYVWDIVNPSHPVQTLSPPSPLVAVEYNPRESHILLGGCHNGQIVLWDERKGTSPAESCAMQFRHQDAVYNVIWMASKHMSEFFTASTDGQVMWWDIRKMKEPLEVLILDRRKIQTSPSLFHSYKARSLEYESAIPTKYLVGTEDGAVLICNRKAKSQSEKITAVYQRHLGPILAVERNPYMNKCYLTVGDWTAKVSSDRLCCVKVLETGQIIACGSTEGNVTLLQLSPSLHIPQKNGKSLLSSYFEREVRREKIMEARLKELRLKEKTKGEDFVLKIVETKKLEEMNLVDNAQRDYLAKLELNKQELQAQIQNMEMESQYEESLSGGELEKCENSEKQDFTTNIEETNSEMKDSTTYMSELSSGLYSDEETSKSSEAKMKFDLSAFTLKKERPL